MLTYLAECKTVDQCPARAGRPGGPARPGPFGPGRAFFLLVITGPGRAGPDL
jgi:hypothetical protein